MELVENINSELARKQKNVERVRFEFLDDAANKEAVASSEAPLTLMARKFLFVSKRYF
jgi:hypothetical protein